MHKLLLLLTLSLLNACSSSNSSREEENRKIVERVFEQLINQKKAADMDLYYMPDVVDHSAWRRMCCGWSHGSRKSHVGSPVDPL